MNIKPLFDKVVIKQQVEEETITHSGILLKSTSQEKPCIADVIAVGDGGVIDGKEITMCVKPGDKVIYSKYSGTEFKYEGQEYIIIRQSDILAIIEK